MKIAQQKINLFTYNKLSQQKFTTLHNYTNYYGQNFQSEKSHEVIT